ncbi:MAG: hypothetical protein HYZ54_00455 [Ignavibacteriae bacterium]|nr:hypothetical protein [Ignavibacteriota bacterium]
MKKLILFLCSLFLLIFTSSLSAQLVWEKFGDLKFPRHRHCAVQISNTEVLVIGGTSIAGAVGTPLSSCEIIDISKGTISMASSMNIPRHTFISLLTKDSNIVVVSGFSNDPSTGVTKSCELFDKKTRTWKVLGNLIIPRFQHNAEFINDHEILVVGGRHNDSYYTVMPDAEIFDINTGTSRLIGNYVSPISDGVSGYTSDGKLVVFGGREAGANSTRSKYIYSYNMVTEKWKQIDTLNEKVQKPNMTKLSNNKLLLYGGSVKEDNKTTFSRDIYIEDLGKFNRVGKTLDSRFRNSVSEFNNSLVLIMGGIIDDKDMYYDCTVTNKCEWFNLNNFQTSAGPNLNIPRNTFCTVSLPSIKNQSDKTIVAIGGSGKGEVILSSVEILEPINTPCNQNSAESLQLPNLYTSVVSISLDRKTLTTPYSISLCPDNKLLIIQMQGVEVNSSPEKSYGKVTSYSSAGNYEFIRVESVKDNIITLSKPLVRPYDMNGKIQILRVPEFKNLTISDKLLCPTWNDTIFGVIAFSVSDTLKLHQSIIADGAGFSGGKAVNAVATAQEHLDAYFAKEDSSKYALKGNGISNYLGNEHRAARGAVANAGGGGNNHNAGGGGGANGGCGGNGGFGWDLMEKGSKEDAQGIGGYPIDNTGNKIFMGGGGGAGHSNEATGTNGGNGGGIIIIDANVIVAGGGQISAKGKSVESAPYDGAGGGGGGGTVIIKSNKIVGNLSIESYGGSGGGVTVHRDGPGGGGGGGVIGFSLPAVPNGANFDFRGGYGGKSRTLEDYGQSDGCNGVLLNNVDIPGDHTILEDVGEEIPIHSDEVRIYPLPADEIVSISSSNDFVATSCIIYDILGNYVRNGQKNAL